MPKKKHHIRLSPEERAQLESILRKGKANAHVQRHTRILLLADSDGPEGGWSDWQIARAAHTSIPTVERTEDDQGEQYPGREHPVGLGCATESLHLHRREVETAGASQHTAWPGSHRSSAGKASAASKTITDVNIALLGCDRRKSNSA